MPQFDLASISNQVTIDIKYIAIREMGRQTGEEFPTLQDRINVYVKKVTLGWPRPEQDAPSTTELALLSKCADEEQKMEKKLAELIQEHYKKESSNSTVDIDFPEVFYEHRAKFGPHRAQPNSSGEQRKPAQPSVDK
jgi:hypothetical protein